MKKKKLTIRLKDEVHAVVSGLSPTECQDISDVFAFPSDNYFFSPEYQLGRWDGLTRFFKESGLTYIELLPDVISELKHRGYQTELVDDRKPFDLEIEPVDKDYFSEFGWTLAEHQIKAIKAILEDHRGIIKVGTGGGKTLITAVLADLYTKQNKRMIIIVPKTDLIIQTKEEIEQFGIEVGAYYAKEKNVKPDVVVSTWQSLGNNPRLLCDFQGVMVDECHGGKANTLRNLLTGSTGQDMPIRIGLSGTLPDHDTDKITVFCSLGPVVAEVTSEALIAEGWLAKLNMTMVGFKEDFKEEYKEFQEANKSDPNLNQITYTEFKKTFMFPEYQNEKSFLIGNPDRMETIASMVANLTKRYGNTFVLVNSVEFGKRLAKLVGDNAIFVSSSITNRKPIYKSFDDNNGLVGIATYSLASTGLNIPRLFNVVLVDGGKSSVRVVQTIGRGLRKAKDKDQVNVIDVYSSVPYSTKHAAKRRKIYKQEKYDFMDIRNMKYISQNDREKTVQSVLKTLESMRDNSNLENEVFD